jgi:phenylpyruvate tautomerase PptA (4-oxalocrotonate tautomerase family)
MPLVKISILKGRSKSEKQALLDAVHAALVEAFKIPDWDRDQRIFEFEKENFEIPNNRTDYFTLIEIIIYPGRSLKVKRELYKSINDRLKANGYKNPNDIVIVLLEPPLENWGIRGGVPASEIDIGYKLDV